MEKNKVIIEVAGQTYDLKLKTKAIDRFERMFGKSVLVVWKEILSQTVQIRLLWGMVWSCVNSQNSEITWDKFLEEVDESDISMEMLTEITLDLLRVSYKKKSDNKEGDSNQKN